MSTLLGVKLKTDQLSWVWCNTPVIPMAQVVCSKPASARDTLRPSLGIWLSGQMPKFNLQYPPKAMANVPK